MISSMSFLVLPWSSQFLLHLFWTTHLQGMSLRRTAVWCGHASSGTLIGIQETLSFIVFLWAYIGFSQRCDRKKSYVIDQLLYSQADNKHFGNTRKHMFWSENKNSHEDQVFVHMFFESIWVSFLFLTRMIILCFGKKANLCTSRNSVMRKFEYKGFSAIFSIDCVNFFHVEYKSVSMSTFCLVAW